MNNMVFGTFLHIFHYNRKNFTVFFVKYDGKFQFFCADLQKIKKIEKKPLTNRL